MACRTSNQAGRKVRTQVHTVNSNSRTSNCQFSLFSKKNQIIRILCISGWLAVPINLDTWSSTVLTTCPAHCNHLMCVYVTRVMSLYILYSSSRYRLPDTFSLYWSKCSTKECTVKGTDILCSILCKRHCPTPIQNS